MSVGCEWCFYVLFQVSSLSPSRGLCQLSEVMEENRINCAEQMKGMGKKTNLLNIFVFMAQR